MTDEPLVTIEVNGRELKAKPGQMLIDVTDEAGIRIPRFCYHKKLSVAANCRMCLVEVERAPKPLPACATPVTDGMKVFTRSPLALQAQQGTMEFLLINHPLDCPICDQGGECELQDVAMGYGGDVSRYQGRKRVVADQDIGPLIATDMTRCIHCTRCVRFGEEIAGIKELGATGRGEHMRIGTYVERSVASELSGNVVDLCPVGALTSKPFRFTARAWELIQRDSIASHDSLGSNLHLHVRGNQVMRVHPRDNEALNECWLSDRDRFSYQGLYSEDRLLQPMIRKNGKWQTVDWSDALAFAAEGLDRIGKLDPAQLATLISPNATLEEQYLAQKLTRGLGSPNIDHRLRQVDFRADDNPSRLPWLGRPVTQLETRDVLLLVGSNIRKDQPLLGHRIRKAALKGASVTFVNPTYCDVNHSSEQLVSSPRDMVENLSAIAKALGGKVPASVTKLVADAEVEASHQQVADQLAAGQSALVLLGNLAFSHPDYALLRELAFTIAESSGAEFGMLPEAANSVGARLAGAVPHAGPGLSESAAKGLDARAVFESPRKGYLVLGVEPEYDFHNPSMVHQALDEAGFVVALTSYRNASLEASADVMLPLAGFAETSGTLVNAEGDWQSFAGAVAPLGESRPGWKILRVLGNLLELDGFEYLSSQDVRDELQALCTELTLDNLLIAGSGDVRFKASGLTRIGEVPLYRSDALVRRAGALQQTVDAQQATAIRLNAETAQQAGVEGAGQVLVVQGDGQATMDVTIDHRIPDDCAWIPAGAQGTESLGDLFGEVTLERV